MTSCSIPLRYSCILHHLHLDTCFHFLSTPFSVLFKPTSISFTSRKVSQCLETTEHGLRHFPPHCLQITRSSQTPPAQPANHESHIHQQTCQAEHDISRRSTHIAIQNSQNNTDHRSSTHATPTMTPFFLTSKEARSVRRSLSTHENISTTASYATKPYLTRLIEPSPYTTYASETRSERLPPWFTVRPTRHAYTPSHSAEVAHRSLAYEISRTKAYGYSEYKPTSYKDLYVRGVRTREAEYAALLREKNREKEKEDKVRVQRRGDELLYVRDKGRVGESGGWRRTEREVEWVRGRWA